MRPLLRALHYSAAFVLLFTSAHAAGPTSPKALVRGPASNASAFDTGSWREAYGKVREQISPSFAGAPVASLRYLPGGYPQLDRLPELEHLAHGKYVSLDQTGSRVYYGLEPVLQARAEALLRAYNVPWGALVAVEPTTGRILAFAGHSSRDPGKQMQTRASFPAASLFKVVTAAAAIESAGMSGGNLIRFRGGNYDLGPRNFLPDTSRDRRSMSLADALGKSVNPVFARVALNNLSADTLAHYARNFGFNAEIPLEVPLEQSTFNISQSDKYNIARTAAGFGEAFISPLHAALLAAAVGNDGTMPRPYLIERIEDRQGNLKYEVRKEVFSKSVAPSTAHELLDMMRTTVETGTARKHFWLLRKLWGGTFPIAAKTGTLSGQDPKGVYHWFIATAPVENPTIAIAALVIDPGNARVRGSGLGSKFLQYYHVLRTEGLLAAEKIAVQSEPVIRSKRSRSAVIRSYPAKRRSAVTKSRPKPKAVAKKKKYVPKKAVTKKSTATAKKKPKS